MTHETWLSLAAVRREPLFEAARALVSEGHFGPAVVVAYATVEGAHKTAVDFALQLRECPDPVREWIADRKTFRTWSLDDARIRSLWRALTGDELTRAPSWGHYAKGSEARHRFAHRALAVSREEAESLIGAGEELTRHFTAVLASMDESRPATDEGP